MSALADVRASYDRVATAYAERFFDELRDKPLDRALLDCFAELVRARGAVLDVGCGPGQIARALRERGVAASGLDLSEEMVALARRLSPEIPFSQGSMFAIGGEAASWAGITAFYAIVHLEEEDLPLVFAELYRVLRTGGVLLLAFHLAADAAAASERVHVGELLGEKVDLDFVFFDRAVVEAALVSAGFRVEARIERAPYPTEHATRRAYFMARKPESPA